MNDYGQEEWYTLYETAMLELQHAALRGRIGEARTAIAARIEKLLQIPGLHAEERQAIEDAINNLRVLEREEEPYKADEARIAEKAIENLRILAPRLRGGNSK